MQSSLARLLVGLHTLKLGIFEWIQPVVRFAIKINAGLTPMALWEVQDN
jgi:hypothetical protein